MLPLFALLALHWNVQQSSTTASLRGLCAVSTKVAWASGINGTFLRTTDGGEHWQSETVAGAEAVDFRDVEAFDADTAYLMSIGAGGNSRIYKTTDAGQHWDLLFTNPDAKGFFDSLAFWDRTHAILVGDPVGGSLVVFSTADAGKTWQRQKMPPSLPDEGAFAASGTSIVTRGAKDAWIASGGPNGARVFRTHNGGRTWTVAKTPLGGNKSAGIFSINFRDGENGVAVGGDYQSPKGTDHTIALTHDGGKTWTPSSGIAFRSGVATLGNNVLIAVGTTGSDVSQDGGLTWQNFSDTPLNAIAVAGDSVWAVGPKGVIVKLDDNKK